MALRRRALGLAGVAAVALLAMTPTGCYLSRAGWEEARILARREPIARLVRERGTDAVTRAKLQLVLDARRFAVDSVRLTAKESFTAYSPLDRDTLVLVLSAAHRDTLRAYTWWFPIVGHVPYKGYFDFGAAQKAARSLERAGYDVYLRPSAAFSTLGFFNDPLLSTTLRLDTLDLANTVIHELTHNTFYAKGQAVFNESFANFVGARGAEWFFRTRGQRAAADEVARQWADEKRLGAFWQSLAASIDSAYRAHPADSAARVRARDTVYARARRTLVDEIGPQLTTYPAGYGQRVALDNAALLARRVYAKDLDLFDAAYEREGRDLRRTITHVIQLAKRDENDPYAALRAFVR